MRPRNIVKQKSVDSSTGAASVLKGGWREPLCLTLHVSTRKKASLPGSGGIISFFLCSKSCLPKILRSYFEAQIGIVQRTCCYFVPSIIRSSISNLRAIQPHGSIG